MITEKFAELLLNKLQVIRLKLDDIENCEDGEEMIFVAQELSTDILQIEELLEESYTLEPLV